MSHAPKITKRFDGTVSLRSSPASDRSKGKTSSRSSPTRSVRSTGPVGAIKEKIVASADVMLYVLNITGEGIRTNFSLGEPLPPIRNASIIEKYSPVSDRCEYFLLFRGGAFEPMLKVTPDPLITMGRIENSFGIKNIPLANGETTNAWITFVKKEEFDAFYRILNYARSVSARK